jgi:hypothetical protein
MTAALMVRPAILHSAWREKSFVSVLLYVWRGCLSFFEKVFSDRVDVLLYLDKQ